MKNNSQWFEEACFMNQLLYKPEDITQFNIMVEDAERTGQDILEARITSFLGIKMIIDTLLGKYPGLKRTQLSTIFPEKSCVICSLPDCREKIKENTKGEFREYCRGDFKPFTIEEWLLNNESI